MKQMRIVYCLTFLGTIVLGLYSRKISIIPLATGDFLYAVMTYWMFRIIFFPQKAYFACMAAILFCFMVEFLQLLQVEPLLWIRSNIYLRLIFGQGFLWSDLVAYVLGAMLAFLLDKKIILKKITIRK